MNTMDKDLLTRFDAATNPLLLQLFLCSEDQLNTIPFEGSWTPGQLGDHVHKSYDVMTDSADLQSVPSNREIPDSADLQSVPTKHLEREMPLNPKSQNPTTP